MSQYRYLDLVGLQEYHDRLRSKTLTIMDPENNRVTYHLGDNIDLSKGIYYATTASRVSKYITFRMLDGSEVKWRGETSQVLNIVTPSDLVIVKGAVNNSAVLKNSSSTASGGYSVALGNEVTASGDYSHAEGRFTVASSTSSHAEGYKTSASGKYSHSEGIGSNAIGEGSHAEGGYYVSGPGIFQGGQASGRSSHAEGYNTAASGEGSHAEGVKTIAQGSGSHAEGGYFIDSYNSVAGGQALGKSSHAEGVKTIARGDMSHVEGFDVEALGKYSHAEGGSEQEIKVFMPRLTSVEGEKYKYKTDLTQIPNNDSKFLIGNWIANIHYTNSGETVYNPQTSIKITSVIESTPIYIVTDKEIVGYPNENGGFDKLNNTPVLFVKYVDKPTNSDISYTVTAAGDASHAEGSEGTKSAGFASHAEGCHTFAGGTYSHSEGVETEARGFASHAEGNLSVTGTYAAFSHAEGSGTKALGARSHAEGIDTIASGEDSHAEGDNTQSIGNNSHAEGSGTKAIGFQSHSEGLNSEASGTSSHAEGQETFAKGARSHAEGRGTYAYSQDCHAEGWDTKAGVENDPEVNAAHAEGKSTTASGKYSHAEGYDTTASGDASHAEGWSTKALGKQSHSEGKSTNASGDFTHAEGHTTVASGNYSHAEGIGTKAEGMGSHAEGGYYDGANIVNGGHAKGSSSHAEGIGTKAESIASHAEGYHSNANKPYSHAEGYFTKADGNYSHAGGYCTITSKEAEFATGKYNKSNTDTLFSVGNGTGTSNANRKNAFEITKDAGYIHNEKIASISQKNYGYEYKFICTNFGIDSGTYYDEVKASFNGELVFATDYWDFEAEKVPLMGFEVTSYKVSEGYADDSELSIGQTIYVALDENWKDNSCGVTHMYMDPREGADPYHGSEYSTVMREYKENPRQGGAPTSMLKIGNVEIKSSDQQLVLSIGRISGRKTGGEPSISTQDVKAVYTGEDVLYENWMNEYGPLDEPIIDYSKGKAMKFKIFESYSESEESPFTEGNYLYVKINSWTSENYTTDFDTYLYWENYDDIGGIDSISDYVIYKCNEQIDGSGIYTDSNILINDVPVATMDDVQTFDHIKEYNNNCFTGSPFH